MSTERNTKQAHEHIRAIVRLTNTLIKESINKKDPILAPQRTLSKQDFVTQYQEHYHALLEIMTTIGARDGGQPDPSLDAQIQEERKELQHYVNILEKKLDKLNTLRFWIDNMVFDKEAPSTTD